MKKNICTITKSILSSFFKNYNIKDMLSKGEINKIIKALDSGLSKNINNVFKELDKEVRTGLKKEYNKFLKKGVYQLNPTIQAYKIQDLKPKYKKELNIRTDVALSYIKTQTKQDIEDIKNRLFNYASIPHPNPDSEEFKDTLVENVLPVKVQDKYKTDKWFRMILNDQTNKLHSSLNYITAVENEAFGFIWRNRKDIRVVGNPNGLYPEGNAMHNNHWDREGKLYLFRDSKFLQQDLIKKTDDVMFADEIEDGIPGVPINCRCTMKVLYRLYDLPKEYLKIVTEKGEKYL